MIERRIIIGLVTSTEYVQKMRKKFNLHIFQSNTARRIATWCIEYYDKYNKAPGELIEDIFYEKAKAKNFPKDVAEEIEEDILPSLSEEYLENSLNIDYLIDETNKYLIERALLQHSDTIKALVESGEIVEAEKQAASFNAIPEDTNAWVDLSDDVVLDKIAQAFEESDTPLIRYSGALGEMLNAQLCRGKFVAFLAPEKRGKTFFLLELAMRAAKKDKNVVFFQAGDMTESEQLLRIATYLTKKSHRKKFIGEMYEPVVDCIHNQLNTCDKDDRMCSFGIFSDKTEAELREITAKELREAYDEEPDYEPCKCCKEFKTHAWGTPWLTKINIEKPMTKDEAQQAVADYFIKNKRRFKLSSHANGTLSLREMRSILEIFKREDNFTPDVIVIDYADILTDDTKEFRHKQNSIWMGLRSMSQEYKALVITATQADAASYKKDTLSLENYSEDKRKYGHVTSMFGLNQDKDKREKEIGIIRINELTLRDSDFHYLGQVSVLGNLRRGRPYLDSYF